MQMQGEIHDLSCMQMMMQMMMQHMKSGYR